MRIRPEFFRDRRANCGNREFGDAFRLAALVQRFARRTNVCGIVVGRTFQLESGEQLVTSILLDQYMSGHKLAGNMPIT